MLLMEEMFQLVKHCKETMYEDIKEPKDSDSKAKFEKYREEVKSQIDDKRTYKRNKAKVF